MYYIIYYFLVNIRALQLFLLQAVKYQKRSMEVKCNFLSVSDGILTANFIVAS